MEQEKVSSSSDDSSQNLNSSTGQIPISQAPRRMTFVEPDVPNPRSIILNSQSTEPFMTNQVRTSRYTLLTWAPKSLLLQFRRVANIYFLIISILTTLPFSPKNPWSMGATFSVVLVFTMLKQAYEDYFRHKQDKEVNQRKVHTFFEGKIVDIKSSELKVGDLVIVYENEFIPADLAFVGSSNQNGIAFVNTVNLDGETNLKQKLALHSTRGYVYRNTLDEFNLELKCEQPSANMHRWFCNIKLEGDLWEPMAMKQLLLRGCILKNTLQAVGVVVYTGHQTKIMLNSKEPPSKVSNILRKMNTILYTVFAFQIFICLLYAGLHIDWKNKHQEDHSYMNEQGEDTDANAGDYFVQILTFWVAYSHLIPISLYVALEIVKMIQAYLISQDMLMYYQKQDKPARVRTSDLVEQLGQVQFVFSDKTGTLTSNQMQFKKYSVNGVIYGDQQSKYQMGSDTNQLDIICSQAHSKNEGVAEFFKLLSVCHSVFPNHDKNDPDQISYQAPSPDEIALVQAAKKAGYIFTQRTENTLTVKQKDGSLKKWEILAQIPFESERKRMSIIVKQPKTKAVILMTKGADNIMMNLIRDQYNKKLINEHIYKFAVDGLRTLVMGQRKLSKQEFAPWHSKWKKLMLSNHRDKQKLQFQMAEDLEKDLDFIGISAIQDKLQQGVPETIKILMDANIRVWVLTGDKQQTAVQIGKSCNIIKQNMQEIRLSSSGFQQLFISITEYIKEYNLSDQNLEQLRINKKEDTFSILQRIKSSLEHELVVIINGHTLTLILDGRNQALKDMFFKLCYISSSCICCRVTPLQKLQVVALAKSNGNWITLSIGDGANDVSMIQQAHIGIGIQGKQGTQAVQSSDVALAQFRFLSVLLLSHGRWAYRRISWFICYYFYKNIVLVFTQLWFSFFNGFSGQIYFLDWLPMLYNSFWTSWPCMITYCFQRDFDHQNSRKAPFLYGAGQKSAYFNFTRFWYWILMAFWHGMVCYWVPIVSCDRVPIDQSGHDTGLWWISTMAFTIIIHLVTFKLFMESVYWTKLNMIVGLASVFFYYLSVIVLNTLAVSQTFQPEIYFLFFKMLDSAQAWICILFVPVIALIPDFLMVMTQNLMCPTPAQQLFKIKRIEKDNQGKLEIIFISFFVQ